MLLCVFQIEFYLLWLRECRLSPSVSVRFHFFNSFLFTILSDRSQYADVDVAYAHVRRWTKGVDLFSKDFVVVPINDAERHHWSLAIIAFPGKQVDVAQWGQRKGGRQGQRQQQQKPQPSPATQKKGRAMAVGTQRKGGRPYNGGGGPRGRVAQGGGKTTNGEGKGAEKQMRLDSSDEGGLLLRPPLLPRLSKAPLPLMNGVAPRASSTAPSLRSSLASLPSPPPSSSSSPPSSPPYGLRLSTRPRRASSQSAVVPPPITQRSSTSTSTSSCESETTRRLSQSADNIRRQVEVEVEEEEGRRQVGAVYGKQKRAPQERRQERQKLTDWETVTAAVDHEGEEVKDGKRGPRHLLPLHPSPAPLPRSLSDAEDNSDFPPLPSSGEDQEVGGPSGEEEEVMEEVEVEESLSSPSSVSLDSGEPSECGRFPCILHFDSLPMDPSHVGRIAGILRSYLRCEWNHQLTQLNADNSSPPLPSPPPSSSHPSVLSFPVPRGCSRAFDSKTFPHVEVQVPHQPNDFDCGPFILEFAQRFCDFPFPDTRPSAVHRPYWFSAREVHKREEVRELLHHLKAEAELNLPSQQPKTTQQSPPATSSTSPPPPRVPPPPQPPLAPRPPVQEGKKDAEGKRDPKASSLGGGGGGGGGGESESRAGRRRSGGAALTDGGQFSGEEREAVNGLRQDHRLCLRSLCAPHRPPPLWF